MKDVSCVNGVSDSLKTTTDIQNISADHPHLLLICLSVCLSLWVILLQRPDELKRRCKRLRPLHSAAFPSPFFAVLRSGGFAQAFHRNKQV